MIEAEDILKVMGRQAKKVCNTVLPNRPNASTAKLTQFIVVSLPFSESNKTLGEDDDWCLDETVVFEIYVADKKTAANPNEPNVEVMKTLRQNLRDQFPIVDRTLGIKITRPRTVINSSSDGNGYHYSRVQAKMTTLL